MMVDDASATARPNESGRMRSRLRLWICDDRSGRLDRANRLMTFSQWLRMRATGRVICWSRSTGITVFREDADTEVAARRAFNAAFASHRVGSGSVDAACYAQTRSFTSVP